MNITLEILFMVQFVILFFTICILLILNRKIERYSNQVNALVDQEQIKMWRKTLESLPRGSRERAAYAKRLTDRVNA